MLGTIMIVAGLALFAGSLVTGYLLAFKGCAPGEAPECEAGSARLISDLMISDIGIFFWLAWVIGVFLIWGGLRLRPSN